MGSAVIKEPFVIARDRLVLEFETADGEHKKFAMDEMSDGYKNTLSMIGDIAYRIGGCTWQTI